MVRRRDEIMANTTFSLFKLFVVHCQLNCYIQTDGTNRKELVVCIRIVNNSNKTLSGFFSGGIAARSLSLHTCVQNTLQLKIKTA